MRLTDDDYAEQDRFMRMQDSKPSRDIDAATRVYKLQESVHKVHKLYWKSTLPFAVNETSKLRAELMALSDDAWEWAHKISDDRPEAA